MWGNLAEGGEAFKKLITIGLYHLEDLLSSFGRAYKSAWWRKMRDQVFAEATPGERPQIMGRLNAVWDAMHKSGDVKRMMEMAGATRGPTAEETKAAVGRITAGEQEQAAVTLADALAAALRKSEKASIAGYKQGAKEGVLSYKTTVQDLIAMAKEIVPPDKLGDVLKYLGKMGTTIGGLPTGPGLRGMLRRINEAADRAEAQAGRDAKREAIRDFKDALPSPSAINKMRPILRDKLQDLVDNLDPAKMTPRTRTTLEAMFDFLEKHGPELPSSQATAMRERAARLSKTSLNDMSVEDIRQVTEEVNRYVKQNELINELGDWRDAKETGGAIGAITQDLADAKRTWVAGLEDARKTVIGRSLALRRGRQRSTSCIEAGSPARRAPRSWGRRCTSTGISSRCKVSRTMLRSFTRRRTTSRSRWAIWAWTGAARNW